MANDLKVEMPPRRSLYFWASLILVLCLGGLIGATFLDYGITFDEPLQQEYGERVLDYYRALIRGDFDSGALEYENLYYYGGFFDSFVALAGKILPLPTYDTRHLITALVGLLGVVGCMRLAAVLGGPAAAFWAGLSLVLIPRYYGHMFNNPKDIPFATAYIWSVYYLARTLPSLSKIPRGLALKIGLAIGAAMAIRVGGAILLVYFGALLLVGFVIEMVRRERSMATIFRSLSGALTSFSLAAISAYLIMLMFWPWAQVDPLRRPLIALEKFSESIFAGIVLFNGNSLRPAHLPTSYLLHYLAITLPEIVLFITALGAALGASYILRNLGRLSWPQALQIYFVAFTTIYPLVHIAVVDADVYDGMRHVLFVLPPLMCLVSLVVLRLGVWCERVPLKLQAAGGVVLLIYLSWHVVLMVQLHPYQTVYFNRLVGGLEGAYGRYETDYHANSYKAAVQRLIARVESDGELAEGRTYDVWLCPPIRSASLLFPTYLRHTEDQSAADFFIGTTRWNCHEELEGKVIAEIERFGVPLAVVKDLRNAG